jgi:predicted GIY-YIG superfamily endonuclease
MLKMNVDSLDAVDEPFRALYEQDGEKFKLKVDGVEDTSGLKNALAAERRRASDLEKKVKGWERSGKTPDEIAELIEAQEARAQSEAEKKGEWDKLKAQMNTAHQAELGKKDESLAAMRRRLSTELVDKNAVAEIAAAGGVPDLLLPHVQRHAKVDDDFNVTVVDAQGGPRVKGNGDPFTIKDLVAEMKASDVFGRAFNGSGQSGGGTPPANGGGVNPQIKSKADLYKGLTTDAQKRQARAKFVEAHGADAYFKLPG